MATKGKKRKRVASEGDRRGRLQDQYTRPRNLDVQYCSEGSKDDHSSPSVMIKPGSTSKSKSSRRKNGRRNGTVRNRGCMADDGLGTWAPVENVPPVQMNRFGDPCGLYWQHMRPYVFERGAYIFPWDVEWNRQCTELKARFILRLRTVYPGKWESKGVLSQLGNSLREKRNRLKKRFKVYKNHVNVARPRGCTVESWKQIFLDIKDPKKKAKSELWKVRAQERVAAGAAKYTHRCGRRGYRGIVERFIADFGRPPTYDEIEFARNNAYEGLAMKTESAIDSKRNSKDVSVMKKHRGVKQGDSRMMSVEDDSERTSISDNSDDISEKGGQASGSSSSVGASPSSSEED